MKYLVLFENMDTSPIEDYFENTFDINQITYTNPIKDKNSKDYKKLDNECVGVINRLNKSSRRHMDLCLLSIEHFLYYIKYRWGRGDKIESIIHNFLVENRIHLKSLAPPLIMDILRHGLKSDINGDVFRDIGAYNRYMEYINNEN